MPALESERRAWESNLATQVDKLAGLVGALSLAVEKVSGRIDGIDQRLRVQEAGPATARSTSNAIVAWIAVGVSALGCGGTLLIAGVTVIATIAGLIIPHLH